MLGRTVQANGVLADEHLPLKQLSSADQQQRVTATAAAAAAAKGQPQAAAGKGFAKRPLCASRLGLLLCFAGRIRAIACGGGGVLWV